MDGFVTKPLRREALVQEMARLIPGFFVEEVAAPISQTVSHRGTAVAFDRDAFLTSVRGNPATMRDVLAITLREDVPRLAQALDESADPVSLEQAAHAIKGLAAELRAQPCLAAAARLEETKSIKDVPLVRERLQQLREALEQLLRSEE